LRRRIFAPPRSARADETNRTPCSANFVCIAANTVTVYATVLAQRDTGPETDPGDRTLLFRLSQATRDQTHIGIRE
jgi:hypothetical protein